MDGPMFNSFIGKFIFFFWLFFLIVTIPIYYFTTYHFKDIIKASQDEKVTITFNSLKPTISIHIFLDQEEQLKELLDSTFENKHIKSIELVSLDNETLYYRDSYGFKKGDTKVYSVSIQDLVDQKKVATLYLEYENYYLSQYNERISAIIVTTILFSLLVFLIVFFYIRYDLIALKNIAKALKEYSETKNTEEIVHSSKSKEISTIANVANEMFVNIAQHVKRLKSFNTELEKRVKYEIAKQQNQEKLMIHQSRQAAMGEMLESIAHQWRQPLNIIGLATVNIETQFALGQIDKDNFDEKINIITKNINYMSDTIDDFRDFLNPKKDMIEFEPKESIESVLSILSAQLDNYHINYSLNSECETTIYGVENEFKQVLIIILNNSKDAILQQKEKDDSLDGKININISCQNNYATIKICDNGGGIKPDLIDQIFDPYFSTKQNANGTGIGLYIAKNIIESRMRGNIQAKNIKDGCCFSISVPIKNAN